MKRKLSHTIALLSIVSTTCMAQKSIDGFYTIGEAASHRRIVDRTLRQTNVIDSVSTGIMFEEKAEDGQPYMERQMATGIDTTASSLGHKSSLPQSHSRELNIKNLIEVFGEVGLSNKLFVLAQAVLETGHFQSRVCKQYNNLFGLYDSRKGDYFHFDRWEDSVSGYKRMIQYRYKGGNYLYFLKRIGYAEDPRYISKVAKIAKDLYHQLFEE